MPARTARFDGAARPRPADGVGSLQSGFFATFGCASFTSMSAAEP